MSHNNHLHVEKPADDGYNWIKYGAKPTADGKSHRCYYRCKNSECPAKKIVVKSVDEQQIKETIYKDQHNHEAPQITMPVNKDSMAKLNGTKREQHDQGSQATTAEHMSDASNREEVGMIEKDENDPYPKRRRTADSHSTVTDPEIVIRTTCEVDLLYDGYRWKRYASKGNLYPRRYYKCTTQGCEVKKHVQRVATDPKDVVTTYKGRHNHGLPAASHATSEAQLRPEDRHDGFANLNHQQK